MDCGGYDILQVLIADDKEEEIQEVKKYFEDNGCKVFFGRTREEVKDTIDNTERIDLVVADLAFGSDMNGITMMAILNDLKQRFFAPIVVFTGHKAKFEQTLRGKFPGNMILSMDKNYGFDSNMIKRWMESSPINKICIEWSKTAKKSVVSALWQTEELDDKGIMSILKCIKIQHSVPGEREFLGLLNKVLVREITSDASLLDNLNRIISSISVERAGINEPLWKKFWIISAYDTTIKNTLPFYGGDLLKFEDEKYGVIITPKCDFSKNDSHLRIKVLYGSVEGEFFPAIRPLADQGKILNSRMPRYYMLQWAGKLPDFKNIVFDFANVASFTKAELEQMHNEAKVERILNIDSPFYEHMIQRYSSYHRLGIPDSNPS